MWLAEVEIDRKSSRVRVTVSSVHPRSSQRTHRWRERDSNPRSPARGTTLFESDCALGAALYPDLVAKSIGCPMVAVGNELYPLPIYHRIGDRASGEKRLSPGRRNRCQSLRSLR